MKSVYFTKEEQEKLVANSRRLEIASKFGFLNAHNGLRRGSVHILIGTAGGGKSTLVRSLVRDFLFCKPNSTMGLSIHLSEETCDEYKTQLVFGMPSSDTLHRGSLLSEEEHPKEPLDYFLDQHRTINPDLIVYDNMTTSRFYEGQTVKEQANVFGKIKSLTKELNCATIVVAHTGAEINDGIDRFVNMNDIRGSKSVPNMAEFLYILQRFKHNGDFFPTIRTVKHRGQDLINDMYFLQYEASTRTYVSDLAISFEKFKEVHGKRNKL